MNVPLVDTMRATGRRLAEQGLTSRDVVTDLDETVWDWSTSILGQPLFAFAHVEWIHVRRHMTALLEGIVEGSENIPVRVWTAGYGYRVDRVCDQIPELARALCLGTPHQPAEAALHCCTRVSFLNGLIEDPQILGDGRTARVSSKIPGIPAASGRPQVEAARILLDDRRDNCELFVAGHPDRMAIHLVGAQRKWTSSVRKLRPWIPIDRTWAPSVALAFSEFLGGARGVVEAHPEACIEAYHTVRIRLPHTVAYREWIGPGRRIRHLLAHLPQSSSA